MSQNQDAEAKIYLVGGGIPSLAAAAFLIRDGKIRGHNIPALDAFLTLHDDKA